MVLNQITIEDILERYSILPDELLTVLEDPNTEKIVEVTCQKNNISKPEWIDIIKQLVGYVLMGFIHYYDLGAEINTELNFLNSKLGNDVASEIDAKIFNQIKNTLEKNYSPITFQKKEEVDIINLQEESRVEEETPKKELQPEPKPQAPQKQEPVLLEKIILEKTKISTSNTQQEKKSPPSFMPFVPIPEKIISQPTQKEVVEILNKKQTTLQNIQTKQKDKEKEFVSSQNKIGVPPPVFIHKEETISPLKKGIEMQPLEIKISNIKPTSPPPKPVQIEIGTQNNKTQKTDLDVRVINYSEVATNQSNKINVGFSKNEESQKTPKFSTPPFKATTQSPSSLDQLSQTPLNPTPLKQQVVNHNIPTPPSKSNTTPPHL